MTRMVAGVLEQSQETAGEPQLRKQTLLRARDVSFGFNGTSILRQVSFTLQAGEFVGLVGPNGAGKSTLLKVITGLWRGAAGQVDLLEKPLSDYSPRNIARIVAHVAQSITLDFAFSTREVVLMGRSPHLGRFALEGPHDRMVAERAMQITDTLRLADRLVSTLSGGERQRVLIARALAQEPHILLLDEPTSNLDIKHQLSLLGLVRSLAHEQGLGVIAAIHDLTLAARFCDRIMMLSQGTLEAVGRPEDVLTPRALREVFGVEATIEPEPVTGGLRFTPLFPSS